MIPGRGLDFVWTRTYRSRIGGETTQGHGWTHSYDLRVVAQGNDVRVADGRGRDDLYRRRPGDTFVAEGLFREGRFEPDGSFVLTFEDTGTWSFHPLDGSAVAGKVSAITDRNGNAITFEYDPAGRLSLVVDTLARGIQVQYGTNGKIDCLVDFTGRQVKYEYYVDTDPGGSGGGPRVRPLARGRRDPQRQRLRGREDDDLHVQQGVRRRPAEPQPAHGDRSQGADVDGQRVRRRGSARERRLRPARAPDPGGSRGSHRRPLRHRPRAGRPSARHHRPAGIRAGGPQGPGDRERPGRERLRLPVRRAGAVRPDEGLHRPGRSRPAHHAVREPPREPAPRRRPALLPDLVGAQRGLPRDPGRAPQRERDAPCPRARARPRGGLEGAGQPPGAAQAPRDAPPRRRPGGPDGALRVRPRVRWMLRNELRDAPHGSQGERDRARLRRIGQPHPDAPPHRRHRGGLHLQLVRSDDQPHVSGQRQRLAPEGRVDLLRSGAPDRVHGDPHRRRARPGLHDGVHARRARQRNRGHRRPWKRPHRDREPARPGRPQDLSARQPARGRLGAVRDRHLVRRQRQHGHVADHQRRRPGRDPREHALHDVVRVRDARRAGQEGTGGDHGDRRRGRVRVRREPQPDPRAERRGGERQPAGQRRAHPVRASGTCPSVPSPGKGAPRRARPSTTTTGTPTPCS